MKGPGAVRGNGNSQGASSETALTNKSLVVGSIAPGAKSSGMRSFVECAVQLLIEVRSPSVSLAKSASASGAPYFEVRRSAYSAVTGRPCCTQTLLAVRHSTGVPASRDDTRSRHP